MKPAATDSSRHRYEGRPAYGSKPRSAPASLQAMRPLLSGTAQKNQASYAAAKEAIRGLSRVAANEWAQDGIRVNIVCPLALTEGVEKWKETNPEQYKEVAEQNPMQRFGDPQKDVAPVVAFLLSDDSQYMTGQTLMADGGDIKLR